MPYQHRTDGRIAVTIDSNVWNQLHSLKLELAKELPKKCFALFMPREIQIELDAIPDRPEKIALKDYIRQQVLDASVETSYTFGFMTEVEPQRSGGWGAGTFQSSDECAYYADIQKQYLINKSLRGSKLSHNEGDAALGAASLSSVVLTLDLKKAGPLLVARKHGGKLVDMTQFDKTGPSLSNLIQACYDAV